MPSLRGMKSGVPVEQLPGKAATLFYLRDSKVVRIVSWWDDARAMADLGLAPESESSAC
jgi:hypothetical protein